MGRPKGSENGKTRDLTGLRFGLLTAVSIHHIDQRVWKCGKKAIDTWWICKCDCGNEKNVSGWRLTKEDRVFHCGCLTAEFRRSFKWRSHLFKEGTPFRIVFKEYKRGAKDRGLVWELSEEQFKSITSQPCHYTGSLPSRTKTAASGEVFTYNGIDRLDSSIGYILENCVPCCTEINMMKQALPKEKFIELCSKVAERFSKCQVQL